MRHFIKYGWFLSSLVLGLLCAAASQAAELPLVQKQRFELPTFITQNGAQLKQVQVGWEAYGKLNTDKSNVILITHYFSGTSHAAGRYQATDAAPGYWDAIIGPGKAIDTNQFYVVSVDTLVNANANANDPHVITTGPASINPATGKRYGLSFPVVTITDFVEVQKALLDSLGINKLHAVVGASMGSFQAIEWAQRYPERVQRLVPVIGTAYIDAYSAIKLERWAYPIKADPHWQQGDYYDKPQQPTAGLAMALAWVTLDALNPAGFNQKYPDLRLDKAAHQDIRASFTALDQLLAVATQRAALQDANHLLYLVRASQLWRAGMGDNWQQAIKNIKAPVLWLPAAGDLLLTPLMAQQSQQALDTNGARSTANQLSQIPGQMGHLDGLLNIQTIAPELKAFLQQPQK
ncbi:homoserine O-acetyltransferase [Rheinheimera texasensis]|uniref:E22 family MetX-like putative esterase n=1 Tax=Rheinheimera texasensis TaxID=306205 RepID=UPI0032B26D29